MMGIVTMTITGSLGSLALLALARDHALLPLDMMLAYLIGGLSGFALAVLAGPLSSRLCGRLQAGS